MFIMPYFFAYVRLIRRIILYFSGSKKHLIYLNIDNSLTVIKRIEY